MSFKLIDKPDGYNEFLMSNPHIQGLCLGLTVDWIFNLLADNSEANTCSNHESENVLQWHNRQYELKEGGIGVVNFFAKYLQEDGLVADFSIRNRTGYSFASRRPTRHMKPELMNFQSNAGKWSIVFIIVTRADFSAKHAVGIFRNSSGDIYYYDPNTGVFLWKNDSASLYYDIKEHLKLTSRMAHKMDSMVFIEPKNEITLKNTQNYRIGAFLEARRRNAMR